ncbi:hypothetical protein AMECASPLE_008525 [Ameca splendens]|uniref:Uncharacterized protein n=1 Tax=Ameca splendens TaxID=208324 RepID=A0ABV0XNY8_9TELE
MKKASCHEEEGGNKSKFHFWPKCRSIVKYSSGSIMQKECFSSAGIVKLVRTNWRMDQSLKKNQLDAARDLRWGRGQPSSRTTTLNIQDYNGMVNSSPEESLSFMFYMFSRFNAVESNEWFIMRPLQNLMAY